MALSGNVQHSGVTRGWHTGPTPPTLPLKFFSTTAYRAQNDHLPAWPLLQINEVRFTKKKFQPVPLAQHTSITGLAAFHNGDNEDKARENKHNREIHQVHVYMEKKKDL